MKRRTFILLGGGAVAAAAVGTGGMLWRTERRKRRQAHAEQLPPLETLSLAQLAANESFDVCIVGSGIAGAILGTSLSEAGYSTIVLESGFHPRSPQQARIGPLEVMDADGTLDYPALSTRLRALGGTTNIWTGNCYRFHPLDLDSNPYAESVGPWPIRYSEIEPWYGRAEETLHVRGGVYARYSPPRSNELSPYIAARPRLEELSALVGRAGIELEAFPVSQNENGDRDPVRSLKSILPGYAASARAKLVSGATVTRLDTADSGEVVGARARDLGGTQRVVRAGLYIIAAGAIESARLLLLSSSARAPNGLGNRHGFVGRGFMEHVARHVSMQIPGRRAEVSRRARCYQFHEEFVRRGLGGMWFTVRQQDEKPDQLFLDYDVALSISEANRVTLSSRSKDAFGSPAPALSFSLAPADEHAYSEARRTITRLCRDFGAVHIRDEPGHEFAHHHMGTCRMGADPETSVVDADLRIHDCPNTYVLSSGVFASSGAGHPTLLVVALAHRLADRLVALRQGTRKA